MKEIPPTVNQPNKEEDNSHNGNPPPLTEAKKLIASELFHACDPELFDFETTDEIKPIASPLGLDRAIEAIKLGIGIPSSGFNIYVMGSTGLGKHAMTQQLLAEHDDKGKAIFDWCYVNNFREPSKPVALQLPAGMGKRLRHKIKQLIEELRNTIPSQLQSEDFTRRTDQLQNELNAKEIAAFQSIEKKANKQGCVLKKSKTGYLIQPEKDGKIITKSEFTVLPVKEQKAIDKSIEELRRLLVNLLNQVPLWDQEMRGKKEQLEREFVGITLDYLTGHLPEDMLAVKAINDYISSLKEHVLDNIKLFSGTLETEVEVYSGHKLTFDPFTAYEINIIVDNSKAERTPVIYEDNPSYLNLVGSIEHRGEFGTFVTNFTLIKPGAFHRANGGYLLIDIIQLLNKPFVWDVFKRTLLSKELRIQPLEQFLSINTIASLEPEIIPLDVKVILMGDRMMYYLLKHYDPDFAQLFKVQADCSEEINRDPQSCQLFSQFIKSLQTEENTRPLDRTAVAKVIEYSARQMEDGEKLSLHRGNLRSLLLEANYWAEQQNHNQIDAQAVQQAIKARQYRTGYLKELITENIHRGISVIETSGKKVGQVNGLSVVSVDETMFGRPCRITATVHLGQGKVINIEREVDLSGPSHSKGVMILTAFLRERYEQILPLSFSATLTFEQSYGMIDGDSASAAELCALLSAIAQIPLKQNISLTGAIDQHGNIEAIGGVNEKIEGFFEICNASGLTGDQGVIIPKTNLVHLMVDEEIRQAVAEDRFHIWAVDHIEQVIKLLTGLEIGEPDSKQRYPLNSINGAIASRIKTMNKAHKQFLNESKPADKRGKQSQ
ncbi:Lon protease family protein [Photobacterium lipolyticum]|nr:AAA family ATPase [Photobacterium lipolyticum]